MKQTDTSEFFLVNVGGTLALCIPQAKVIDVHYCYRNEKRQKGVENFVLWLGAYTKTLLETKWIKKKLIYHQTIYLLKLPSLTLRHNVGNKQRKSQWTDSKYKEYRW
jgi:hypothetical protein